MPELPEVETTRRGISPWITGAQISQITVRNPSLRWPVPVAELQSLLGKLITRVERRAKYLLLYLDEAVILLHLGMSGSLRVLTPDIESAKHDHIDIVVETKADGMRVLRLTDPRRFGCCLILEEPVEQHPLLNNLGPEPLSDAFDADYLFARSRKRKQAIKNFIMDGQVVVGVGNIYASEALYLAGIRPTIAAGRISRAKSELLVEAIKSVLAKAIEAGGTTLNDFTQSDGKPGYFAQQLQVYGRAGEPCFGCGGEIKSKVIGQRNTYYCTACQT